MVASNYKTMKDTSSQTTVSNLPVSIMEFLKRPDLVGSAFPASKYLTDTLLEPIKWEKIRVVIEYGPGTGPVSRAILERMPWDGHLIAIDISPGFTRHLRDTIKDPRLLAITGCASSAPKFLEDQGFESADLIVTGIPFSTMSSEEGHRILDVSTQMLTDSGALLAYQMRSTVAPMLTERFRDIQKSYVWRNIPPCHLYWARMPRRNTAQPPEAR